MTTEAWPVRPYGLSVIVSVSLILLGIIPTIAQFTACTAEALNAVVRSAHDARRAGITSDDAEGAVYQVTYRTCMQRRGF